MDTALRPWNRAQLRTLALVNVTGAVVLGLTWGVSSTSASLGSQVRWLDLAILTTLVAAGADALWLATGRRGVLARRSSLLAAQLVGRDAGTAPVSDTGWWYLPGTSRVHRAGCQLIAGKPSVGIQPGTPQAKALRACEICAADRGVAG